MMSCIIITRLICHLETGRIGKFFRQHTHMTDSKPGNAVTTAESANLRKFICRDTQQVLHLFRPRFDNEPTSQCGILCRNAGRKFSGFTTAAVNNENAVFRRSLPVVYFLT